MATTCVKKPSMTPAAARDVLQSILDDRKEIVNKSVPQYTALHLAAWYLEAAERNGANVHHEACILRYHANNLQAVLCCDLRTRNALKVGIRYLNRHIGGGGDV